MVSSTSSTLRPGEDFDECTQLQLRPVRGADFVDAVVENLKDNARRRSSSTLDPVSSTAGGGTDQHRRVCQP
jgi:hypothetical protein